MKKHEQTVGRKKERNKEGRKDREENSQNEKYK